MLHLNFLTFLVISGLLVTCFPFAGETKGLKIPFTDLDEEAFFLKRIAEFWKDGDFKIVQAQILDFLDQYPHTSSKDPLLGVLGDIYLHEKAYEKALSTYQLISDPSFFANILLNKLHCYYELNQYRDLVAEGAVYIESQVPAIQDRKEELHFLMGEAFFRIALESKTEEEQMSFARQAQSHYDSLPDGEYKHISELAIAEIYAILGENQKGAVAYQRLAEIHPEMEEDLCFEAASLQAKYDPVGAIDTFRDLKDKKGKRTQEAAFNEMVLLSQTENHQAAIDLHKVLTPTIPNHLEPICNYIIGKSFFSMGDYQNAHTFLKKYRTSTSTPSEELKNALLIEMTCAHALQKLPLFQDALEDLGARFPGDPQIPNALFMEAMLLKEEGSISKASEKLKEIKESYPEFSQQEPFIFESGVLAHKSETWQTSYDLFKSFVTDFPNSPEAPAAWKLFLSSAFNLYKNSAGPSYDSKQQFFKDLQTVLDHSDCLSEEEQQDCAIFYAKVAYELDHYAEALSVIERHIFSPMASSTQNSKRLAEAHLIASVCHAEGERNAAEFLTHLNRAVALNPTLYDSPFIHLHLYNAYITLAGYGKNPSTRNVSISKKEWIDQAAIHLEEVIETHAIPIQKENLLWLANYLYQIAQEHVDFLIATPSFLSSKIAHAINRATHYYETLLLSQEALISIDSTTLFLEEAILNLAKLFGYQTNHEKKVSLLKALLEQQAAKEKLDWRFQKEALFDLAVAYQDLGDKEKAFETYTFLKNSTEDIPTHLLSRSMLESARLHFTLLEPSLKEAQNPDVIGILNDLKTLQMCKDPSSEPIHLEAALDYAQIRSLISDQKDTRERDARYRFFLDRIQEDFKSEKDASTQAYLTSLYQNPSKKSIFEAYMAFIDAEKLGLEIKDLYKKNQLEQIGNLEKSRLALYTEIKNTPNLPRDLLKRIEETLRANPLDSDGLESKSKTL